MKNKKEAIYTILSIAIILIIFLGFKAKRYVDCDLDLAGGAPGGPRPAYCDAQTQQNNQIRSKYMAEEYQNNFQKDFVFQCKIQQKPELPPETQQLYNYAYYHDLHNLWDEKEGVFDSLAHYYRIAAANGDYRANVRLQYLIKKEKIKSSYMSGDLLNLNKELEKQLPATAYYNTYGAINEGHLETEQDGQFAFLRKAAELGSAEAQYELSNVLMDIQDEATFHERLKFANELEKCASENGYAEASNFYGIGAQERKNYKEALLAFHLGVQQGDSSSASWLGNAFEFKSLKIGKDSSDNMYNLDLDLDLERSKRYKIIQDYLSTNDYLNPKVPDLDQIVPLPPAKLPAWDGKIAFQRWYEGSSPEKPSEALVEKLAKAKGLDPKTGLPLQK